MTAPVMSPEIVAALEVLKRAFGGVSIPTCPTVRELWTKYEAAEASQVKSWDRSLECGRQILAAFGDTPALSITLADIDEWRAKERLRITNRGKPPSAATRNRVLIVFRRLLNWSYDRELIDRHPLDRLKLEKENNLRETVLTDADVEKLLKAAAARPMIQLLILLLFDTGCRRSEILNLRWDEIDAENCCIRLGSNRTKNKRPRSPHLTNRALGALLDFPRRHPTSPYVFANKETGEVLAARTVYRDFEVIVARAGLEGVNGESICFHSLRHAYIAKARKLRMPEKTVMAQTGHLTRCAYDRYGGQSDDDELATLAATMEAGKVAPR
jgi:integrase